LRVALPGVLLRVKKRGLRVMENPQSRRVQNHPHRLVRKIHCYRNPAIVVLGRSMHDEHRPVRGAQQAFGARPEDRIGAQRLRRGEHEQIGVRLVRDSGDRVERLTGPHGDVDGRRRRSEGLIDF
jgi:hypothetical protein